MEMSLGKFFLNSLEKYKDCDWPIDEMRLFDIQKNFIEITVYEVYGSGNFSLTLFIDLEDDTTNCLLFFGTNEDEDTDVYETKAINLIISPEEEKLLAQKAHEIVNEKFN